MYKLLFLFFVCACFCGGFASESKDKCLGENEYFACGSACDNECAKPDQNQTNCPIVNIVCNNKCYCKEGTARNEKNICVPLNQCPNITCPGADESLRCVNGDTEPTCENQSLVPEYNCDGCKPKCVCNEGLYRNKQGECVSSENCGPRCGPHEFYDCGLDCDNDCSTLGRQNRTNCRSRVKTCMCYCNDGYARNVNNTCVLVKECNVNDQCFGANEVLRSRYQCPPETTCKTRGRQYKCLRNDTEQPKNVCVCRTGYYRNSIGNCISNEQCDQCSGINEYFSCGSACDNECAKPDQNQTNCPIVNIVCNEKCYCEEGTARNEKNICVPLNQCPQVKCGANEEYKCVYNCPPETNCSTIGKRYNCPLQREGDCTSKCVCKSGFVRNDHGRCIPEAKCTQVKCGDNEEYKCVYNCPPETNCSTIGKIYDCPLQKKGDCTSKCVCKSGFVRNDCGRCIPEANCKKCGLNEVYQCVYNCPPERTCSNRAQKYFCPLQKVCNYKCVCQPGTVRNYIGQCIPKADCDKCPGKHEFYSPDGGACDNRCDTLETESRSNCSITTPGPVAMCYCEDNYARDDKGNCIPVKQCTEGCGPHEYNMKCKTTCPPDTCISLVARFKCDSDPPCCPGCRCQSGFLRKDADEPCMPMNQCPQLANSFA